MSHIFRENVLSTGFCSAIYMCVYNKSKSSTKKSAYSSRSEWIRAIELYAQANAFASWGIDCTLVFDREVPAGSISATAAGNNITLDSKANANDVYPKSETMSATDIRQAIVDGVGNIDIFAKLTQVAEYHRNRWPTIGRNI